MTKRAHADGAEEMPAPKAGPKPFKSYKNQEFLNSGSARMIRIMCELQQPQDQLERHGVENIVMFFGSARAKPEADYKKAVQESEAKVAGNPDDPVAKSALQRLRKQAFLVPYFEATRDLAAMLTKWSDARGTVGQSTYTVGTGGGPGMMQAANEGAFRAGGRSAGLGISLPFEDRLNPFCSPEISFEFHYFFTRKFWMAYKCMGLVVAPGGLGTCDELFELLTLRQTGRIRRTLPIILIGKDFWNACINWQAFVDYGMISEQDKEQLLITDSATEAFDYLVRGLEALEEAPPTPKKPKTSF